MPRRADDFVDSFGINLDLDFNAQLYNETLLGQLGIRHFRSNAKPGPSTLIDRLTALYTDYGCRTNVVCDTTSFSPTQYRDLVKSAIFESVEGLNEPDIVGPRSYLTKTDNWSTQSYPATIAYQQDLFSAMASNPLTSGKAVLTPAMANPAYSRYLRTSAGDFIAVHSYPSQLVPTANYLTSFELPAASLLEAPGSGVTGLIATETGYKAGNSSGDISYAAAAKYIPRTFAEYFRLGVARTYLFELADPIGGDHYGIIDSTFSPKPAYTTVRNLAGMLNESTWNTANQTMTTPAFNPSAMDFTLSGATPDVHHVLLQKSTGTYYLLLWQEVPCFDLTSRTDLVNPPVPVTLSFNFPIAAAHLYNLQSTVPLESYSNPQTIAVNVPDEVVVLELTPGSAGTSSGALVSISSVPAGSSYQPLSVGTFVVARTGAVTSPLNVSYTLGGSAQNGTDYTTIPASVQIPAGASFANISIRPDNPSIVGRKDAIATVAPSSGYLPAKTQTSRVFINSPYSVVEDFENGIQRWTRSTMSTLALDPANADSGNYALKWVYNNDGVDRWMNSIQLNFAAPQDWSAVSRLTLRMKEGPSNSSSVIGKPVYFSWINNGTAVGNGLGVAKFPLSHDSTYRSVSLDLGDFPRNRVNALYLYVDGKTLTPGTYTFYLDNIGAVTDSNGVLDDVEQYAGSNWSGSARSTVAPDSQNADTGAYGLKWVFNNDGITRWDNFVTLNFRHPQDLTRYTTLCLRFKEDPSNPAADIGADVIADWHNDGVGVSGGTGVDRFGLQAAAGYRTVEVSLGSYSRDAVDDIYFYVDGKTLTVGKHTWYLDNITAY